MGQFDVNYKPDTVIKRHTLADFIAKFIYSNTTEVAGIAGNTEAMKEVETEKGRASATKSEDNSDETE